MERNAKTSRQGGRYLPVPLFVGLRDLTALERDADALGARIRIMRAVAAGDMRDTLAYMEGCAEAIRAGAETLQRGLVEAEKLQELLGGIEA